MSGPGGAAHGGLVNLLKTALLVLLLIVVIKVAAKSISFLKPVAAYL